MSFNSEVKSELIQRELNESELLPMLCGFSYNFRNSDKPVIRLKSSQATIIKYISSLINKIYNKDYKVLSNQKNRITKETIFSLDIPKKDFDETINIDLNDCKKFLSSKNIRSFLSGLYLASGYIVDPNNKKYMLYIIFKEEMMPKLIINKLSSYEDDRRIEFKFIKRKNSYEIYIKKAIQIANFLAFINAYVSMLNFENIRVTKDFYNNTNRLAICDSINYAKSLKTGQKNLSEIRIIEEKLKDTVFDEKTKIVISIRKNNVEASYSEIAEIASKMGHPMSKSSVAQIFSNITKLALKCSSTNSLAKC